MSHHTATFNHLVRDALNHMYDHVYLQMHPLTRQLANRGTHETHGMTLHRVLMEAIEALRPPPATPATDAAWRPYYALHLRYVEGRDAQDAAAELSISPRQFRRDHARGVEALVEYLTVYFSPGYQRQEEAVFSPQPVLSKAETIAHEVSRFGSSMSTIPTTRLVEVLSSAQETLANRAAQRNVAIRFDISDSIPAAAVERVVLRQIVLNILSSLLECVHDRPIHVSASVASNKRLQLRFTVQGGEHIASFKTSSPYQERLEIAAQLITLQAGEMHISSEADLDILVLLPAQSPTTVVIVDDNPDIVQLFQRFLRGSRYQGIGCTDSQQVLQVVQCVEPSMIVLDVMMPNQDGWELLQLLKSHPATQTIPIVVCSVLPERVLALSLGATDFLAKPVSQQSLLSVLARCAEGVGG